MMDEFMYTPRMPSCVKVNIKDTFTEVHVRNPLKNILQIFREWISLRGHIIWEMNTYSGYLWSLSKRNVVLRFYLSIKSLLAHLFDGVEFSKLDEILWTFCSNLDINERTLESTIGCSCGVCHPKSPINRCPGSFTLHQKHASCV